MTNCELFAHKKPRHKIWLKREDNSLFFQALDISEKQCMHVSLCCAVQSLNIKFIYFCTPLNAWRFVFICYLKINSRWIWKKKQILNFKWNEIHPRGFIKEFRELWFFLTFLWIHLMEFDWFSAFKDRVT